VEKITAIRRYEGWLMDMHQICSVTSSGVTDGGHGD